MKRVVLFLFIYVGILSSSSAQLDYTANDIVVPYDGNTVFCTNMGWYKGWQDEQLADIAAGNPALGIKGVGVQALRPTLPEHFLDQWGYDVRIAAFEHYKSLGLKDHTCFVEGPAAVHRETEVYCGSEPSHLFRNIYLPIWDNGENGTPVNDDNFYALYLYETAKRYKDYIKFWEVWNEPDFAYNANSTAVPGEKGNWWENNPAPCDYKLRAPIQHYIRTLRISYEVIKSVDPDAYICVGGLGYPSFLDAILRNTDNPANGSVAENYPLKGGAYFDVMSYHSYPHIDNSLRQWNNAISGFDYFRHSDASVEGVFTLRDKFKDVLENHNYNGNTYPEKLWIITESNVPRVKFGEFIGSEEAQINFLMKSLIRCQQEDILQFHVFNLGEANSLGVDVNEFNFMGLYKPLASAAPYNHKVNKSGVAYHTTSMMLSDATFDATRTDQLNMPNGTQGYAFQQADGEYMYALWAETTGDNLEEAMIEYNFPEDWNYEFVESKKWDYSRTNLKNTISAENLVLGATPIFVKSVENTFTIPDDFQISLSPNPFKDSILISYNVKRLGKIIIEMLDINGRLLKTVVDEGQHPEGAFQVYFDEKDLAPGVYFCRMTTTNSKITEKVLKRY